MLKCSRKPRPDRDRMKRQIGEGSIIRQLSLCRRNMR
jgi:hypothetical protein